MKGRALALALIAALSLGSCQTSGELLGRTIRIENESLLSDPSASRSIGDLAQGDQRILLNFWGSWCVPCREEIPLFAEYDAREESLGVLVGVLYKDAAGPGAAFTGICAAMLPSSSRSVGHVAPSSVAAAAPGPAASL